MVALSDYVFNEGQDLCVRICGKGIICGKAREISTHLLNHCSISFLQILLVFFAIPFFVLFKCDQSALILLAFLKLLPVLQIKGIDLIAPQQLDDLVDMPIQQKGKFDLIFRVDLQVLHIFNKIAHETAILQLADQNLVIFSLYL